MNSKLERKPQTKPMSPLLLMLLLGLFAIGITLLALFMGPILAGISLVSLVVISALNLKGLTSIVGNLGAVISEYLVVAANGGMLKAANIAKYIFAFLALVIASLALAFCFTAIPFIAPVVATCLAVVSVMGFVRWGIDFFNTDLKTGNRLTISLSLISGIGMVVACVAAVMLIFAIPGVLPLATAGLVLSCACYGPQVWTTIKDYIVNGKIFDRLIPALGIIAIGLTLCVGPVPAIVAVIGAVVAVSSFLLKKGYDVINAHIQNKQAVQLPAEGSEHQDHPKLDNSMKKCIDRLSDIEPEASSPGPVLAQQTNRALVANPDAASLAETNPPGLFRPQTI